MPWRRTGITSSVTIDRERLYLTANGREDGTLGEVFIQWGKQGSSRSGLMDAYAVALSVGLQHGIPLLDLVHQGIDLWFTPNGKTDDPDIPRVRSVADWIARRLALDWLPYEQRAGEGIYSMAERMDNAHEWMATEDARMTPPAPASVVNPEQAAGEPELEAFLANLSTGLGTPVRR
jgi:ribonucleoside-diphosphate reductase alpha chain